MTVFHFGFNDKLLVYTEETVPCKVTAEEWWCRFLKYAKTVSSVLSSMPGETQSTFTTKLMTQQYSMHGAIHEWIDTAEKRFYSETQIYPISLILNKFIVFYLNVHLISPYLRSAMQVCLAVCLLENTWSSFISGASLSVLRISKVLIYRKKESY